MLLAFAGSDIYVRWLLASLLVSAVFGGLALWRRRPAFVFVSGMLASGSLCAVWLVWWPGPFGDLVQANVLLLASAAALWTVIDLIYPAGVPQALIAGRRVAYAHVAVNTAVGLLGSVIAVKAAHRVFDLPDPELLWLDWLALAATIAAVTICLWDRAARFPLAALYALAWILLAMGEITRGTSPGKFYLWMALAESAGLLLVLAGIGWLLRWPQVAAALCIPADGARWSDRWFLWAQAVLLAALAVLTGWVSTDFSFDGMGTGVALFGMVGRACACPAALMLLGCAIVMAWQSSGWRRAAWQFTAMAAGVFFTTSIGWARIDAATATPWLDRSVCLMISTGMMTAMTWIGLPRALPKKSDWISRGREATPFFAGAALLLLAVVLIQQTL